MIFILNVLRNITRNVETQGFEKLRINEREVFISNHASYQDVSILHEILPNNVVFAIDSDSEDLYIDTLRKRKHIIYDVIDAPTLKRITKTIEKGEPLLIFPEAKVTNTGSFMKVYKEIVEAILEGQPSKIYPILIVGVENASFFPSPDMKVILDKPLEIPMKQTQEVIKKSFFRKETVSKEEPLTPIELARYILKQFQLLRFQHAMKKEINLFNELVEIAKIKGERKVILEEKKQKMTYKDFLKACYVFAQKMKGMFQEGEVVGTFLPTSIGHTIALFSMFKLGVTPALLNITHGQKTLIHCIETANIKRIVTSKVFLQKGGMEEVIKHIKEECEIEILYLEDLKQELTNAEKIKGVADLTVGKKSESTKNELILFTSGSENKPKGVILTHRNIYANIQQAMTMIDLNHQDKLFNMLPTFHSFGLTVGTILPLLTGIPVFLYPSPLDYKDIPRLIYRKDATIIFGTSTFFGYYAKSAESFDFHTIRYAIAGAEKLQNEVKQVWNEEFGIRILEGYGVTETAPVISINTNLEFKKGTVGQLVPGMEYKIEKVEGIETGGKLLVKGPNVMKGYLIHDKGFFPCDEWYDTGDIVEVDDEGYLRIVTRLKRFAKIGGEMVSLELVESLARECYPDVKFGAVRVTEKKKGEKIILFATNQEIKLKGIKQHIKEKKETMLLAPKDIYYIEEIPLLGSGKTNYVELTDIATQKEE